MHKRGITQEGKAVAVHMQRLVSDDYFGSKKKIIVSI